MTILLLWNITWFLSKWWLIAIYLRDNLFTSSILTYSSKRRERRKRDETKNKEEREPLAKNSQRSPKMQRTSSFYSPFSSPPGRGGQLFYWLRVAAHALGATVSVNRAKPPKSERRIIALVNLRASRRSFSFIRRAGCPSSLAPLIKNCSPSARNFPEKYRCQQYRAFGI